MAWTPNVTSESVRMESSQKTNRSVNSVFITAFGGYDKIKVEQLELQPDFCGDEDVEVKVSYCGINFADLYLRQGIITNIKFPYVLGLECVGIVENVGNRVQSFQKGQRVLCYRGDGGLLRETVILHQKYCYPIPEDIEDKVAVTLPANYLTAYFSLFDIGNLRPGQRVLIHSCAGGVGWAATQLAKTVDGVTVIGTASNFKHDEVKKNGVDYVVASENYLNELQSNSELKEFKYDVIIDTIAGRNIQVSLSLLRACGKVIVIGASHLMNNDTKKISLIKLLKSWWTTKNIVIYDLLMNNWVIAGLHLSNLMNDSPEKVRDAFNCIQKLYQEGKVKPRIDSEYDFSQVVDAMKKLANRENIGKVIIQI